MAQKPVSWFSNCDLAGHLRYHVPRSVLTFAKTSPWKPIQTFLYDWWPLKRRRDLYRRLAQADCEITI